MLCDKKDIERLNNLFADEAIYPFIVDDTAREDQRYKMGEYYLNQRGTIILSPIPESAFVYQQHNGTTFNVHANVLKHKRKEALNAATASVAWVFDNTRFLKIIAFVSPIFPNVCGFTEKCGFTKEGVITKSLLRDGVLYDQNVYGLTKEDFNGRRI